MWHHVQRIDRNPDLQNRVTRWEKQRENDQYRNDSVRLPGEPLSKRSPERERTLYDCLWVRDALAWAGIAVTAAAYEAEDVRERDPRNESVEREHRPKYQEQRWSKGQVGEDCEAKGSCRTEPERRRGCNRSQEHAKEARPENEATCKNDLPRK